MHFPFSRQISLYFEMSGGTTVTPLLGYIPMIIVTFFAKGKLPTTTALLHLKKLFHLIMGKRGGLPPQAPGR